MDKEVLELLKDMAESINKRFDKIEAGQEELKTTVKAIDKKIDTLYNAVAEAKEDITEIKEDVKTLKESVGTLENVTKTNCYDIANLRLAK